MPIDIQCRLCGQLMGVAQFSETMFDSRPALFRFQTEKFAVKHVGKYSFVSVVEVLTDSIAIFSYIKHPCPEVNKNFSVKFIFSGGILFRML